MKKFIGLKTDLAIIEPWDLVTQIGEVHPVEIVECKVIDKGKSTLFFLFKFCNPFEYKGVTYQYCIAEPRSASLSDLSTGSKKQITFGIIRISEEHAKSSNPFDTTWWRGGGAMLGDIIFE